jgi:hypothetical protein
MFLALLRILFNIAHIRSTRKIGTKTAKRHFHNPLLLVSRSLPSFAPPRELLCYRAIDHLTHNNSFRFRLHFV